MVPIMPRTPIVKVADKMVQSRARIGRVSCRQCVFMYITRGKTKSTGTVQIDPSKPLRGFGLCLRLSFAVQFQISLDVYTMAEGHWSPRHMPPQQPNIKHWRIHDNVEPRDDNGDDHDENDVSAAKGKHDDAVPGQNAHLFWPDPIPESGVANQQSWVDAEMRHGKWRRAFSIHAIVWVHNMLTLYHDNSVCIVADSGAHFDKK